MKLRTIKLIVRHNHDVFSIKQALIETFSFSKKYYIEEL